MNRTDVLADLKRHARINAAKEVRNCPLSPMDQQAWVDFAMSRVTDAHADAAIAWAARFVADYQDLIAEMYDGDQDLSARRLAAYERLAWWKRVAEIGGSVGGYYDAVGTRDALRGYLRGDFYDEIDACLSVYADEGHAHAVIAALSDVMARRDAGIEDRRRTG